MYSLRRLYQRMQRGSQEHIGDELSADGSSQRNRNVHAGGSELDREIGRLLPCPHDLHRRYRKQNHSASRFRQFSHRRGGSWKSRQCVNLIGFSNRELPIFSQVGPPLVRQRGHDRFCHGDGIRHEHRWLFDLPDHEASCRTNGSNVLEFLS